MWDIEPGIEYASHELLTFDLYPAHRIHLARRYNLGEWITDAVHNLLVVPLQNYTDEDFEHLGMKIFVTISTAKETIATERKRFGNFAPYPKDFDNGPYCMDHSTCKRVWFEKWFMIVLRCIHLPKSLPFPWQNFLMNWS